MKKQKSLTDWIDYFLLEFLPFITQAESDFIQEAFTWEPDCIAAFAFAKRIFEEKI